MHEWAAVNTWSRPVTNPGNGRFSVNIPVTSSSAAGNGRYSVNIPVKSTVSYGRYSVNIPVNTAITPQFGLRRCKTTLFGPATVLDKHQVYKPRQAYRESSTMRYIQYLKVSNKESEAKLKNRMHVLNVQRSKSDLDVRDSSNTMTNVTMMGGGLLKERTNAFMAPGSEHVTRDNIPGGQRQEMKVGMAVVNKKGLISLSTTDESNQLPELSATGESQRQSTEYGGKRQRSRSLIKRKDIMDHFKAGFKILEDEELQKHQEEELQKSLGDYTIMDLQSKILEMTDARSIKRAPGTESPESPTNLKKAPLQMKQEKTITLPAIKNINPFAMKS